MEFNLNLEKLLMQNPLSLLFATTVRLWGVDPPLGTSGILKNAFHPSRVKYK
jgi:hypothetical protein